MILIFGAAVLAAAGLVMAVAYYLRRLAGDGRADTQPWFWTWLGKGLGVPVLFWIVWNLGILPGLPSLLLQRAQAKAGITSRVEAFFAVTAAALLVMASYWAAVSFAWFLAHLAARKEIRNDFLGACLVWSVLMVPLALFILYLGGWLWAGLATLAWLLPIANSSLPLAVAHKAAPMYSRAIAKMKMGKYEDAEWEVIQQLEECEDDFDGWMMLAELYANHFADLAGAERTVREICRQPNATPSQISVSLHRLADWHLKPGEDPVAARRALEEICQRLPGTHLATMAGQRLKQLPASREELREQRKGRRIRLPALNDQLEEGAAPDESQASRAEAAAEANRCVERLKQDPNNVPAREELARLFAERLDRVELAIEQVELLLAMPEPSPGNSAEWLSLIAAWQLKYRHDTAAAQALLERLVREHPQSAQAFAAQRHLKLMEVEQKLRSVRAPR